MPSRSRAKPAATRRATRPTRTHPRRLRRETTAPRDRCATRFTLTIEADAEGHVTRVDVTVRVPHGAGGVVVSLRVESKLRTASAHAAGPATIRVDGIPVHNRKPGGVAVDVTPFVISGNIDPTDAILDATSPEMRSVQVTAVAQRAL